jgi:hypothetical protein
MDRGEGRHAYARVDKERQLYYQCGAAMVAMEDYFSQHEDGLLSDERDDDQSGTAMLRVHRQSLCW